MNIENKISKDWRKNKNIIQDYVSFSPSSTDQNSTALWDTGRVQGVELNLGWNIQNMTMEQRLVPLGRYILAWQRWWLSHSRLTHHYWGSYWAVSGQLEELGTGQSWLAVSGEDFLFGNNKKYSRFWGDIVGHAELLELASHEAEREDENKENICVLSLSTSTLLFFVERGRFKWRIWAQ